MNIISACKEIMPRHQDRKPPSDFIKDIPTANRDCVREQLSRDYLRTNKYASILQLDSLELGYDSLQIRVWLGHSMAKIKQVVILNYHDSKWNGYIIDYKDPYYNTIPGHTIRKIKPQSGWKIFIQNLFNLQILTLPDEKAVDKHLGPGTDGISYDFEWATVKKYRFYKYNNPDYYSKQYWQADNVIKIANLLEEEFNFQYLK